MRLTTSLAGLVALAAPFCAASLWNSIFGVDAPLGINCRGSAMCHMAAWDNALSESITQLLRDVVWNTSKNITTIYHSGEHIICVGVHQAVSVVFEGGRKVAARIIFNGNIHEGGVCLFPQGGSVTLGEARVLVDELVKWGCGTCGSVPLQFHEKGSNDPSAGILTFNYVKNPYCINECITGSGKLFPGSQIIPRSGSPHPGKRFEA